MGRVEVGDDGRVVARQRRHPARHAKDIRALAAGHRRHPAVVVDQDVVARAAVKRSATRDGVVAVAAPDHQPVPGLAQIAQHVVACAAENGRMIAHIAHRVVARARVDMIVAGAAAARDVVVAVAAQHRIRAAKARYRVGTRARVDQVGRGRSLQRIRAVGARDRRLVVPILVGAAAPETRKSKGERQQAEQKHTLHGKSPWC